MTIKAKNKKNFQTIIKEYREKGYFIITYTPTFVEMEKGNTLITITR